MQDFSHCEWSLGNLIHENQNQVKQSLAVWIIYMLYKDESAIINDKHALKICHRSVCPRTRKGEYAQRRS